MAVKELAKRVKDLRMAKLLTQPQMAMEIGLSLSTLVRIEMGEAVSDLTRAKVEKYLKSQKAVQAA